MINSQGKKVLVIAAHPDDEVLGCGGTIARHTMNGDIVRVLILGEGVMSRSQLSESQKQKDRCKLHEATQKAAQILGIESVIFKEFPDNAFDRIARLDIIHQIEPIFDEFKPEIIYTHHRGDVNIDHRYTAEAVEALCRPLPGSSTESVFSFEVPSSTEWNFMKSDLFRPNTFFELSEKQLKKKEEALEAYESEIRAFPHPRSTKYIHALAQVRGGQAGYEYAEAFQLCYGKVSLP